MNAKALGGLTALHIAAHYSHVEVVRQLLHFGADLTIAASRTGHTALHVATRQELVTLFLLICKFGKQGKLRIRDSEIRGKVPYLTSN